MLIIGKQVTNENQEKESGQPSQPSLYKVAPTLNAGRLDTPSPVMENANNTCRNSKFGDFPKRNQVKILQVVEPIDQEVVMDSLQGVYTLVMVQGVVYRIHIIIMLKAISKQLEFLEIWYINWIT